MDVRRDSACTAIDVSSDDGNFLAIIAEVYDGDESDAPVLALVAREVSDWS